MTIRLLLALLTLLVSPALWSSAAEPRERIMLTDGWRFLHEDTPMVDTGLPPFYGQVKDWVLPARNAFVATPTLARPVAPMAFS